MTIGYVLDRFPSLHQTFVLNELLALQALGVRLAIFSLQAPASLVHEERSELHAPVIYAPPLAQATVYAPALLRALIGQARPALATLRLSLAARRRAALTNYLRAAALAPRAAALGVRHFHAHFATGANVTALGLAALNRVSFSVTTHAVDLYARPVMLCPSLSRAAFSVTVSDYNRRHIAATCGPAVADRVRVVHAGIDPERFAGLAHKRPIADQPPTLLSVGRLVPKKGHHQLVESVARLRREGVALRLLIVGEGPEEPALAALIARHQLADSVELRPAVTQTELRELLAAAELFVLPCIVAADGDRDGIPVVLMEAMAAGLPVVSTTLSGIPELVSPNTGVLVPPGDVAALAEALAALLADPARRRGLAEAGPRVIRERFDSAKSARQLADLFAAAIAGRDGVGPDPAGGVLRSQS